ncbi:MAG: hypothetical protein UH071_04745 [Paludibacteraceae bacterium]|nr:hypothetical protein [Paludibacteraceae bacterium]
MTFKEIVEKGVSQVVVTSYGYDVVGIFGHYEPFGNKARKITFTIKDGYIEHPWLWFRNENQEHFEIDENGVCTCFDPELFARDNW